MKITQKILGIGFLLFILPTLVSGGSVTLDHGTNSLVEYDDMDNLTADRTLTINWSNNFTGYDGGNSTADVVIAIYVPVDYGVISTNNVTINNDSFQKYNVSAGNCTELNTEANKTVWHTNCTLITINGTLQNPAAGVGFSLNINITLNESCANAACVNKTYELMFSDMITYKKLVNNAVCDVSTYNNTGKGETYCYVNGSEVGVTGVNYSYCSVPSNRCYSCAVTGQTSGNVTCNITKGIGNMYNATYIMEQGTTGKVVHISGEEEFTIRLWEGWNLISIPLDLSVKYNASSLMVDVDNQAGKDLADQISRRKETGGYETHQDWFPETVNNFNLSPGYGYFLHMKNATNFTLTGRKIDNINIHLYMGWGLIGWGYPTNASSVLGDINTKIGTVCADQISRRKETGGYETHQDWFPETVNNFNLSPGYGYFLHVKDIPECQNIQWQFPI